MTEQERLQLAQHLAEMKYKRARAEVRRLDPAAKLKYWRNSIKHEWHTAYELPTLGIKVTLVEIPDREPIKPSAKHIGAFERVDPRYVEARVEDWPTR